MASAQSRHVNFTDGRAAGEIAVPFGQSVTVTTSEVIERVVVGNPVVADAVPLSDSSLAVTGYEIGRTTLTLFAPGGGRIGVLTVEVSPDVGDLSATLRQAIPGSQISVSSVNGRLQLNGTVPDAVALSTALDLARQYSPDPVVNALRVTGGQQVLLEVRFVEATRNTGRELGVSWFGQGSRSAFRTGYGTGVGSALPSNNQPFGSVLTRILDGGVSADLLIQTLEANGLARRLAEPNLVALSGEQASFLAGGEIPVPVAESDGQVTVSYKEYGVRLNFVPTVLADGMINLRLEPEVSQIDTTTTIRTGTITIPAFSTRRVSTVVELRDGQSFAIAGLLQNTNNSTQAQVPFLGQVPVLGALFRSSSYQRQETDLVVIVTPRLAQPAGGNTRLSTPLDNSRAATDMEFFLLGQTEVSQDRLRAYAEGQGIIGPFGHILDIAP
ncbi:type II and III secretion system protein family protein [Halodurantibacterium flavum]|uniref:Type II and III secretion system protein family protein n=1 Tax=Halodurantibacterium flavum TaxID=1382802 RepID=A0ABW4S626_9RHOB